MLTELRTTVRGLLRARWSTALQLATIAFGVGGLSAVLAVVAGVVLRPLPFKDASRLVTIDVTSSRGFNISTSIPNVRDWGDRTTSFAAYGGIAGWNWHLTRNGTTSVVDGAAAYGDFFDVLQVRPLLGRTFTAAETEPGSPPLVVVGHSMWVNVFGADSTIVGRSITLDGFPHTVTGVLPPKFAFPRSEPDVVVNMGSMGDLVPAFGDRTSSFGTRVFARVKDGLTIAAAAADVERAGAAVKTEYGPLTALPSLRTLSDYLIGSSEQQLWLLLAAVGIVMLIATGNAGGLVLARAADRRRDAAVRLALGGDHGDIRRQFVVENIVLALTGGALGLVLATVLVRALIPMLPADLPQSVVDRIAMDTGTIAITLALCLVGGVVFGLAAARQAGSPKLLETLRGNSSTIVAPRTRARSALLVGETALSVVLAIGAALLLTSFLRLRTSDKGFNDDGLLMARVASSTADSRAAWLAHYVKLIEQARALPGVTSASASLLVPLSDRSWELRVQPAGATESIEAGPSVLFNMVSEDYFATFGVPLLEGRAFNDGDRNETAPVAIIDETMAARFWPGRDAIGQLVTLDEKGLDGQPIYRTVVGIAKNVRHYTLREPSRIQIYIPLKQTIGRYGQTLNVVVKTAVPPSTLVAPMRALATSVDPASPASEIHPVSFYLDQSIAGERTLGVITIWLAAVAALVTAVGLFGLVSYAVVQRRREFALRLALGARTSDVVRLITWSGVAIGLRGIVIGVVGAMVLSRLIAGFLYGVRPLDLSVYALCVAGVLAVTALTALAPALGVRRLSPAAVLRED